MVDNLTSFESIIDRSMSLIKDYRLDNLYKNDKESFIIFMSSLLLNSIDDFSTSCLTDLSYHTETETNENLEDVNRYYFDNDLSNKEISILSKGLAINWMSRNVLDVEQMNLKLNTKNFRSYSEANNLQRKQETLDRLKEEYSRNIEEYQLSNLSKLHFFGN